MGCNEAFLTARLLFPNKFKAKVFKTPGTCTANRLTLSPTRPTCFAAENTIELNCSSEGARRKKLPFKGERGGKNMGTGRKAEGTLLLLWCWYQLFSPQLSKEALKQTYTDSSKGLKEGHRKVMCLCYC